jgi:tetratricopeptide (TPR) repeat protein
VSHGLRPRLWGGLIVVALLLPGRRASAQDDADRAWDRGDTKGAWTLYSRRLAADSADLVALQRLGLMAGWDGRYEQSLRLLDRLLKIAPDNLEAAVDRARVRAWQGRLPDALRDLDEVLARAPGYVPALEARAQVLSWAGEYREAISGYEQLGQILPENRSIRASRAQVLAWAARHDEAIALYDSLVRSDPTDRAARGALGQALGWAGRLDTAAVVYQRLLAEDTTDLEALAGLARVRGWQGRLKEAERRWRQLLVRDATYVPGTVGLAQTLRWEGRDAAALDAIRRAGAPALRDRDVRTERTWAGFAMRPRTGTTFSYESDSDGNGISTLGTRAAWRPVARVELRASGYLRWLSLRGTAPLSQQAYGGLLEVWTQVEPGWAFSAGLGASGSDVVGASAVTRYALRAQSPGREGVVGTISFTYDPIDGTAPLVQNRVTVRQLGLDLRAAPRGWTLTGTVSRARFEGSEPNDRTAGAAAVSRRVLRDFTVGGAARVFGFQKDLNDGYFDPDLYVLLEAPARWQRAFHRIIPAVEVAPGLQKVGSGGSFSAAVRLQGELRYAVAPGREVALTGGYSTLGMALFASDVGNYKYRFVTVSGAWRF